jgi:hypothetical protein
MRDQHNCRDRREVSCCSKKKRREVSLKKKILIGEIALKTRAGGRDKSKPLAAGEDKSKFPYLRQDATGR